MGRVRTSIRCPNGTAEPVDTIEVEGRPLHAWRDLEDDVVWVLDASGSRASEKGLDAASSVRHASVYERIHRGERFTREGSLTASVESLLHDALPFSSENAEHFELCRRRVYDAVVGIRGGRLLPHGGDAWAKEANRLSHCLRVVSLFAAWLALATIVSFGISLFYMCLDVDFVVTEPWPPFLIASLSAMVGLGVLTGVAAWGAVHYDKRESEHLGMAVAAMAAKPAARGAAS